VPPAGGTLLVFRRTPVSWHGHKRFVGERRMLQLNFIRNNRLARYTQQAARFSTRMMKQIARIAQPGQDTGPGRTPDT
jgi:SM-20-related protein